MIGIILIIITAVLLCLFFIGQTYPDPVKGCDLYKEKGCSHVDGYLCDYPDCSMLKEYKSKKEKTNGIR